MRWAAEENPRRWPILWTKTGIGGDSSYLKDLLDDESVWPQTVYAEAYYWTAKTLTRSLRRQARGGRRRDAEIIPILFLWRHHIEISLKIIIPDIAYYTDKPCPSIERVHDLAQLWKWAKKGLEELVLDAAEIGTIDRAIKSLSRVDPTSQAFRYPRLKGGSRSAPGLDHVNPRLLDRAMTSVAKTLEIGRGGLEGLIEKRFEAWQAHQELLTQGGP